MTEEPQTPTQAEPNEPEIQTIPPEFYGGLKKVPHTNLRQAGASRQPLVAQVRKAPSPASAMPQHVEVFGAQSAGTTTKRFSFKMMLSVSGGIFALFVGGISYYYIDQARVIKQGTAKTAPTQQTETAPVSVTSTPETTSTTSTVSPVPVLQPLSGVIFPFKTFTQTVDIDNDGLTDIEEILYGTDPEKPDSDGDGFLDGLEVVNLYNPLGFKPVRLIDSGRVNAYVNPTFGYSIYYPNLWTAQSLDITNGQVMFSSGNGAYIEVIKVDNPLKLSIADWYKGQSPGTEISSLKPIITKDKIEGVVSPDGLTAYLPFGNTIYAVSYNIGLQDQVSFLETFTMMVNSLRYPGLAEQSASGVPSVVAPTPNTSIPQAATSSPSGTVTPIP